MGSATSTAKAKQPPAAATGPRLPDLAQQLVFVLALAGLVLGALGVTTAWQDLAHIGATARGTFIVRHCEHQDPLMWRCTGDYVTAERSGQSDAANVPLLGDGHKRTPGTQLPASLDAGSHRAYVTGLATEIGPLLMLGMAWFAGAILALFRKRHAITALCFAAGAPLLAVALVALRF
jgi:hypothetical protein